MTAGVFFVLTSKFWINQRIERRGGFTLFSLQRWGGLEEWR